MKARQQRVVDRGDVVFYLEDIGERLVISTNDEEAVRRRKEYNGFVTFASVSIFFIAYGVYLLLLLALARVDTFQVAPFSPEVVGVVAILLLFFARNFGWYSCGQVNNGTDDRARLNYPVRWYAEAGISAGFFMSIIIGVLFFAVSEVIYGGINRDPLRYESVVIGIFAFGLFFLLGGFELGRRYAIVAHPEEGQRFLLISTMMATLFWVLFFFVFLFWPRTRFDLLTTEQVVSLLPAALSYSLVTGLFIGLVSALVFSHVYLRHIILFTYLRANYNLQITYRQVLEHNVEVGLLRHVGGGYIFSHSLIMDHFNHRKTGADHARNS